jgi:ABC-type nitrate/sulfonate/bicarbonate transport system substrate-binding protein
MLQADPTLQDFNVLVKAKSAVENHEKLMGELLKATREGLKWANMQRT